MKRILLIFIGRKYLITVKSTIMNHFISKKQKIVRSYLPNLSDEDYNLINNLPDNYVLQVPYIMQEDKHLCGSAVVQMMLGYQGLNFPSQSDIANSAGWNDWQTFNHATFKEKLVVYLLNQGQLPVNYYPQMYVATKMQNGIEATKFIRSNSDLFNNYDYSFFKAQIVKTKSPLIFRIHFTDDIYPMDENMMIKYDNSGHCLLMIGYDNDGFIFHDPWNKSLWGGSGGGEYLRISYDRLMYEFALVNYSLDSPIGTGGLKCRILPPQQAVITNSEIELVSEVNWPSLESLFGNKPNLQNLSMKLTVGNGFTIIGSDTFNYTGELCPGQTIYGSWKLSTNNLVGSYPVSIELNADASYPEIPWESIPPTSVVYSKSYKNRICIFDEQYLLVAGVF